MFLWNYANYDLITYKSEASRLVKRQMNESLSAISELISTIAQCFPAKSYAMFDSLLDLDIGTFRDIIILSTYI